MPADKDFPIAAEPFLERALQLVEMDVEWCPVKTCLVEAVAERGGVQQDSRVLRDAVEVADFLPEWPAFLEQGVVFWVSRPPDFPAIVECAAVDLREVRGVGNEQVGQCRCPVDLADDSLHLAELGHVQVEFLDAEPAVPCLDNQLPLALAGVARETVRVEPDFGCRVFVGGAPVSEVRNGAHVLRYVVLVLEIANPDNLYAGVNPAQFFEHELRVVAVLSPPESGAYNLVLEREQPAEVIDNAGCRKRDSVRCVVDGLAEP